MGSIYKQAPNRNLNISVVCFPLLHCSWQTADNRQSGPALPSAEEIEQRNPRAQTVQKIFSKYLWASEFQNL